MIPPGCEHQQGLGEGIHRFVEEQGAQLLGQRGAARLARDRDFAALLPQHLGQRVDMGRLARAVDAFEGDEKATLG